MALLGLGFKDSILAAACSLVKGFRAFVSRETRFGGPQTVRADGREGTHGYGPAILMGIVGQQPTVRSRQIQAPPSCPGGYFGMKMPSQGVPKLMALNPV
jgi:hypothetical protein